MSDTAVEGYWDIFVTSLQDICNSNEALSFDNIYENKLDGQIDELSEEELLKLKEEIVDHKSNLETVKRLIGTSQQNLETLIKNMSTPQIPSKTSQEANHVNRSNGKKSSNKKAGRSFFTSRFNPSDPINIGSEVAYKLKNLHFEEWIQCEVMKVIGDGTKFEIRDPEPDENNNPGQTFKANYKEILLIPKLKDSASLMSYPYGSKVLARYPETTTFYPAVVVGTKKDGKVRLKFDGEEEVNKETEVERRLVLPFPEK